MRIRSSGNGEPGTNGGPAGDLYIEIRIKQHEIFERDGDDLHCTIPVGLTTAALGGSIEVPTLNGNAEIELPEGTQHGKTFRLRGKGIKGVRSSYPGDLYCHVSVETPVKITEHQRKLLKELDESLPQGRRETFAERQVLDRPRQEHLQVMRGAVTRTLRCRGVLPGSHPIRTATTVPAARRHRTPELREIEFDPLAVQAEARAGLLEALPEQPGPHAPRPCMRAPKRAS